METSKRLKTSAKSDFFSSGVMRQQFCGGRDAVAALRLWPQPWPRRHRHSQGRLTIISVDITSDVLLAARVRPPEPTLNAGFRIQLNFMLHFAAAATAAAATAALCHIRAHGRRSIPRSTSVRAPFCRCRRRYCRRRHHRPFTSMVSSSPRLVQVLAGSSFHKRLFCISISLVLALCIWPFHFVFWIIS